MSLYYIKGKSVRSLLGHTSAYNKFCDYVKNRGMSIEKAFSQVLKEKSPRKWHRRQINGELVKYLLKTDAEYCLFQYYLRKGMLVKDAYEKIVAKRGKMEHPKYVINGESISRLLGNNYITFYTYLKRKGCSIKEAFEYAKKVKNQKQTKSET